MSNQTRKILGLDVSTACIGVCVIEDTGQGIPKILELTHVSPKVSSKVKGIEALFIRDRIFRDNLIRNMKESGITDVVIEEPLPSSNNLNTVTTLLRFNGMISESVYTELGIVPSFISSYDAREFSFPELMSLRKFNKKGEEYPLSHIKDAIKKDHLVLFGSYPFDVDKKTVMMNMVNDLYNNINWIYDKKGELRKENFDACDALICALAYVNINRNGGVSEPTISATNIMKEEGNTRIDYTVKIWNEAFNKNLLISNK